MVIKHLLDERLFSEMQYTLQTETNGSATDFSLYELLQKIDSSWYIDYMENLSEKDRKYLLSLLPQQIQEKLSYLLSSPFTGYVFEKKMTIALTNQLFKNIFGHPPLPLSYLCNNPLFFLLDIDLQPFIFLLGLCDFIPIWKKILRGSFLQKINIALSMEEKIFCQTMFSSPLLKTYLPIHNKTMNIYIDPQTLRKAITKQGAIVLKIVLIGLQRDFTWYIKHFMPKNDMPTTEEFEHYKPFYDYQKKFLEKILKIYEIYNQQKKHS